MGNHEFAQKLGEKEDEDYKAQSAPEVKKLVPYDIRFASRVIGGINFVAIDNAYYYFLPDSIDKLKRETQKGLPIVLCLHTPLYEKSLFEHQLKVSHDPVAFLCGVPDVYTNTYPDAERLAQKTDNVTLTLGGDVTNALVYVKGQESVADVADGKLQLNLAPGEGVFVVPYKG